MIFFSKKKKSCKDVPLKKRKRKYVWEDGDKIWIGKGKIKGHDFVAVPM